MRSRSNRHPINDQPEDWDGDGSWTVDCVCGVNYDDGEEMVNCDECGVWVHTRCSGYDKEETSFTCDECKRKKSRNENEETEVARLLAELPTKTITMSGGGGKSFMSAPPPARTSSLMLWTNIPPVEERVHVQGVPGGDARLFKGVSAVFTPELWKCSGYVPKKFNFQYREFPCWDEKGGDNPVDNSVDNPVDRGADALFSLSKEVVMASPVEMLVGLRGSVESGSREKNMGQKEGRNRGSEDSSGRYVHNSVGKESNIHRSSGVNLGKRKDGSRSKDFTGKKKPRSASKEVDGRRRVPSSAISGEKVVSLGLGETKIGATDFQDSRNKDKLRTIDNKIDNGSSANTYKLKDHLAVSAHYARDSSRKEKFKDGLAAEIHHNKDWTKKVSSRDNLEANAEDSYKKVKHKFSFDAKSHNADDSSKKGKSKEKLFAKPIHAEDFSKKVKSKDNLASNAYRGEDTSKETWGNSSLVEIVVKSENAHEDRSRNGSSSEAVTVEVSLLEPTGVNALTKYEDLKSVGGLDHLNDEKHNPCDLSVNLSSCALPPTKLKPVVTEVLKNQIQDSKVQDSIASTAPVSLRPDINIKTEANEGLPKVISSVASSLMVDVKLDDTKSLELHPSISVSEHLCESSHVCGTDKSNIPSDEKANTEAGAISCRVKDNGVEGMLPVSGEPCQNKEVIGSAGTLSVQECSSETKHLKCSEELSKTGISPSIPTSLPQRKVVLGCGKSSSTLLISKSEVSGVCKPPGRPASPSTLRPIHFTKRVKTTSNADIINDQTKPNSNGDTKKADTVVDTIKEDHRQDEPRKTGGEQLKVSTISTLKSSHMSRVSHASISKRNLIDSKEVAPYSSSKAPTAHNVTVCSGSIESINALQSQSVSLVQSKTIASDFSEKGEKFSQSGCHPSSKLTSSSMHPPAPVNSSTLSDEELALLLHQELNSSPRVPRVPRVRHPGSIPQLASTTATNMLIKRASSTGIKDHIWVSRRKNKEEAPKDVSHSSCEVNDERKRMGSVLSNDHRRQDEVLASDSSTKKDAADESPEAEHSAVKHTPLAAASTFGHSSSTEVIDQNLSSPHNSSRNTSEVGDADDDDVDDADADADDDDAGRVAGPATRTLPGLLDEIMSKGKRMTYEELCNAVLPHWNSLRKHNGERYAYSSHSQAVLDCLRNRNEWARLVDRGPKTNAGRKKRRPDEPPLVEPEESEYSKSRIKKDLVGKKFDAHTEDFPKGKRKARKRRRLALQGKGIRDVRKKQKTNAVTDEDLGSFSHSSDNGGVFSEESQGVRTRPNGTDVSASSDEADQ